MQYTCGKTLYDSFDTITCGMECICVAENQPPYIDCLKKNCKDSWKGTIFISYYTTMNANFPLDFT